MSWLRHAFALDPPGVAEPSPEDRATVDRFLSGVVRRGLTAPALLALESVRPLHYLGAQAWHALTPISGLVADAATQKRLATFLERRGSIEYLCRRLEELDAAAEGKDGRTGRSNLQTDGSGAPSYLNTTPPADPHEKD